MLARSPAHPAGFIEPCLPTLGRTVPGGPQWAYEIKHDGYRFIARRDGDRVRVFSRHGKDWSDRVPLIVEAMRVLPVTSATIDGEGVVVDGRGVTDFERLRAALAERGGAAFLYGFDLLALDGEDGAQAWLLTQSLNAFAARSPAVITRLNDPEITNRKIAVYEAIWAAASPAQ